MRDACRALRRGLLLDALGPVELEHLHGCAACRAFADDQRQTAAIVREHRPDWRASLALRQRVHAALEDARSPQPAPAPPSRWGRLALALAASLALAGGVWLVVLADVPSAQAKAHAINDLLVEDYLKYAHRSPDKLQVASARAPEVEAFFRERLRLATRLPQLAGFQLVGGRKCGLGKRPAALAFYERRQPDGRTEPLSLFVFQPGDEDWSAMHELPTWPAGRACYGHERGVGVLVWQELGMTYAAVGRLDVDQLAALAPHPSGSHSQVP